MDGDIIAFDDDAQEGIVATPDGQRYPFSLSDWRGRGLPGPGIPVRFDARDGRALQVINRPEAQRRATRQAPSAVDATPSRRYANWAIAAIVTAMLSLFFDMLAPLLGLVATLFALLGLRQIRREPERYQGRGFCWAAIVLALAIATLSLLVEPMPEPGVSDNAMPGSEMHRATS